MVTCWERAVSWLSAFAVLLYAMLIVYMPFPGCLGQDALKGPSFCMDVHLKITSERS